MNHLKESNIGYFKHMFRSIGYSITCLKLFLIFITHSIFPFIFETTGSETLAELLDRINKTKK